MTIRKIGIVSGVTFELDAFRPDLAGDVTEIAGVAIRSLVHADKQVLLACEGIGKVASAATASLLASAGGVDLLIVLGTAGKIGPREEHLFKISSAFEADYGAEQEGRFVHYTAGMLPIGPPKLSFHEPMPTPMLDLAEARIATSDSFVESPSHAAYLHENFGADLVDMETAAVAHLASRRRLPWCAIKATTDGADGSSAADFHTNLTVAARAAAIAAEELIGRL